MQAESGDMLNRQKVLLYMLAEAGRPVSHLELVKWSFLLRKETASGGGNSFYEFLPYHYGPFSFCLYKEVTTMKRRRLLLTPTRNTWQATQTCPPAGGALGTPIKEDVLDLLSQFKDRSVRALTDYVYLRHPWFTVNSKGSKKCQRPLAEHAAYTVGYEGLQVDAFLNNLIRSGITRLIDVRHNPIARRYGFHKKTLGRLCGHVGINYIHIPQVGIPSAWRRQLRSNADYRALFMRYEHETLESETETIDQIAALMLEKPSALMCAEANPDLCHRAVLAKAVARRTGLPIRHLGGSLNGGRLPVH